ncbi:hypothetical protein EQ875_01530 [Photobacterium damselae subsp. damselae]|uniref:fimbrial protein n=1 Tax=Photobacterium damselae TaxID=38293 RepID=UPI00109B8FD5|nr:fimbrial protein [Photobacterium damselae]TGZ35251.1 hypothetical protein EQ875_01530 [Photobacterium damselae subsp. damselae]
MMIIFRYILLFYSMLLSCNVYAVFHGECQPGAFLDPGGLCYNPIGSNDVEAVEFNSYPWTCVPKIKDSVNVAPGGQVHFNSNLKGATATFDYYPKGGAFATTTCEEPPGVPSGADFIFLNYPFNYLTTSFREIVTDERGEKWVVINDKIEMQLTINQCSGGCSSNHPVDFVDFVDLVNNGGHDTQWVGVKAFISPNPMDHSYMYGSVTLRLRKNVYDGDVGLRSKPLYSLGYYVATDMNGGANTPSNLPPAFDVVLDSGDVILPSDCHINNDTDINIDFQLVQNNRIDSAGVNYQKNLEIPYSCNSKISSDVTVELLGDLSKFSNDFFKTSNENIGIKITNANTGNIIKPNEAFFSEINDGQGADSLKFSLISDGVSNIQTGSFDASIVMRLTIP